MPPDVLVYGPFRGTLRDDRMRVRLLFPDNQNADLSVPYVEVDSFEYAAQYPWPTMQVGVPLTRINVSDFADEPRNWVVDASLRRYVGAATVRHVALSVVALAATLCLL